MADRSTVHYASFSLRLERDLVQLRNLTRCHYAWGTMLAIFSCLLFAETVLDLRLLGDWKTTPHDGQPWPNVGHSFVMWSLTLVGGCSGTIGLIAGVLNIVSGKSISRRKDRLFSIGVAVANCVAVPIGTALGIVTFRILSRPSVQALYAQELAK